MVKIRLRRMGARNRPFYRVVVSDTRRTPRAPAIDELGYYDPCKSPVVVKIDLDKVDSWVKRGAQLSPTVKKLVRRQNAPAKLETPAEEPTAPVSEQSREIIPPSPLRNAHVLETVEGRRLSNEYAVGTKGLGLGP